MTTKVAPRPIQPQPQSIVQELQARLNNGHLDVKEVLQLEKGWGQKPVTSEQAREFRQTVLGWANRMPAGARKELQAFIETKLPTLTTPGQTAGPRDISEELQLKALGPGRVDVNGARELIEKWSQQPVTADEAQNMTAQLLGMTGTFDSKEARTEVQRFLREKLPTLVSNPEQVNANPDLDLRLAAMDDGHLDARDASKLIAQWGGKQGVTQDQARALHEAVTRNQAFIDPGEARDAFKCFLDRDLPKMTRLVANDGGPQPGATTFAEALQEPLNRGGHIDGASVDKLLAQYGDKAVTLPQANQLRQTVLNNASNMQPEARLKLQQYVENELPKHIATEPGQTTARAPADDLRLKALGTGSISVAGAQSLVADWGSKPVSAQEARGMVRALADNSGAFESNAAIQVVQRFVQDKLPGLTDQSGPRDLGFELKAALADDGKLDAGDARRLVDSWRTLPTASTAQQQQLTQMVQSQLDKIEPGEARNLIKSFVCDELPKKIPASAVVPDADPKSRVRLEHAAPANAGQPTATIEPETFRQALTARIQNDGHLDLQELGDVMKTWRGKPMTASQAAELRGEVLGNASRIQPDARRELQKYLEGDLPKLTADDPNMPSTPPISQQLELKALGNGTLSLDDTRALISQWSRGPITAQQANEMKYAVTGQPGRFASNEAIVEMQGFLQGKLPGLVKDATPGVGRDPSLDLRVAMLDDGRIDAAKANRLVRSWEAGPKLTPREAHDLRSTVANSLRFVDDGPAKQRLVGFAEQDLAKITLPTTELDTPARPAPKTLQESLVNLGGGRGDEPMGFRRGGGSIEPEKITAALEQFRGQALDSNQAEQLRRTALELGPSLSPASKRALQGYLENELPKHTAPRDPGTTAPFDPFSQLQLKAFGNGTISEAGAADIVRGWSGREFTASEAQQLSQIVTNSAGLFESNDAIAKVQRFVRDELPKRVTDPVNFNPSFNDQLRLATLDDGRLDSRAAGRLIDGWKKQGPINAGRANELIQSVLDRSADIDPGAGRALRSFIERDLPRRLDDRKQLTPDFTQQLRVGALETGRLDLAGAERLVETWGRQKYTPEQASALVDAVVSNSGFIESGRTREVLQRFLENDLGKKTAAGPDGKKVPRTPEQAVAIMSLTGGSVDAGEARRLTRSWNQQMTPGRAESIRRAVGDATLDRRGAVTMGRFVDRNLSLLALEQALTSPNTVKLSWTPPFANEDGSLLTDLKGYEIDFGSQPGRVDQTVQVTDPAAITAEVPNLTQGTWYFRARTIGGMPNDPAARVTSRPSNEVSKLIK